MKPYSQTLTILTLSLSSAVFMVSKANACEYHVDGHNEELTAWLNQGSNQRSSQGMQSPAEQTTARKPAVILQKKASSGQAQQDAGIIKTVQNWLSDTVN